MWVYGGYLALALDSVGRASRATGYTGESAQPPLLPATGQQELSNIIRPHGAGSSLIYSKGPPPHHKRLQQFSIRHTDNPAHRV